MSGIKEIEKHFFVAPVRDEWWGYDESDGHWEGLKGVTGDTLETPCGDITIVDTDFPDDESRGECFLVFQFHDEFWRIEGRADSYGSAYWFSGATRVYPEVKPVIVYKAAEER